MKLISFAALSFLAITVSAHPGLGTPPQDLEEPQSTASQILLEDPRQSLQDELDELDKEYKEKQAGVGELQNTIDVMEKEKSEIESSIVELDRLKKANLPQKLSNLQISLDKIKKTKRDIEYGMRFIKKEYDSVSEELAEFGQTPE
ncbi:hypothetical protein BASA81_012220 [Batrachochytrium salamandrivorans]|nr:hypothetical protein BASA81_012220 [Batrachochytrium salamandrivorans]